MRISEVSLSLWRSYHILKAERPDSSSTEITEEAVEFEARLTVE